MFDQTFNLVREQAGDAIISNPLIPNERDEEAINEASNSIASGLQDMFSSSRAQDLLKMFSGRQEVTDSPVANNISGGFREPDE
jgi:hypothetical protein